LYLKSLELHGFKSFPEKTVLNFNAGATVIVGPNGSGKSNITDAMRWVLGELSTKNIRGSKMEDVIFVGADGRRPMNFAEVSVTFDDSDEPRRLNSPYTEITVTRRYYRSGDSEYYINRKPVRLRDINELFMNTGVGRDGYSIIGQGRIAEIISKKNEERRSIFEETAGISKYRYRKNESERRLAETEANMLRVSDILSELEGRVGPMEKAAAKARRYLELYAVKREADVSMILWELAKKRDEAETLVKSLTESSHELEMIGDTESQLDAMSERLFAASEDNKAAESRLYGEIKEKRDLLHRTENEYRLLENNAEHERRTADTDEENGRIFAATAAEEEARGEVYSENLRSICSLICELEERIAELNLKKEELRLKRESLAASVEQSLAEIREYEALLGDTEIKLGVIATAETEQESRSGSVAGDIEGYRRAGEELLASREDTAATIADFEREISVIEADMEQCRGAAAELDGKIDSARGNVAAILSECEGLRGRIAALRRIEEHFEGYNHSVRHIMNRAGKGLDGIHGPLSMLIRTSPEHATAIEIALGAGLQNIVVENEASAKAAIGELKRSGAGRATFCPLTSVKGQGRSRELEAAGKDAGFVGFADELVRCDEVYRGIVSYHLGRIAVFRDIDSATVAAKASGWRIRIVTLDGQQINAGGSFTGGSVKESSGILTRASQIETLETRLEETEKKLAAAKDTEMSLRRDRDEAGSRYSSLDERCTLIRVLVRSEQATLDELEAKIGVNDSIIGKLEADARDLGESSRRRNEEKAELLRIKSETEEKIRCLSEDRVIRDSEKYDCDSEMDRLTDELSSLMISMAEAGRDRAAAETALGECTERAAQARTKADEFAATAKKRREDADNAGVIAAEMRERCTVLESELAEMEERRVGLENGGLDYERKIRELQARTRETASKKELVVRAHTKNENRYELLTGEIEKMTTRLWDEYELTVTAAAELGYPPVTEENRAEIAATLTETRNAIKALGQVNVEAIEEYTALKERYDYVRTQMDDLEASKAELYGIISSIEEEMRRMFMDAFEKINHHFGETFKELFGGGHAELSLTDPEDVLNCGIEISAAPPGKMIKNLSLLSGGEQAFIAIALLFALIKVNPSPFCIFDEIEAALDEVNVARVANYVSREAKKLQIIMITHRRGTMEIADTLYGVTMPNRGISKVFTLDANSTVRRDFAEAHLN